MKIGIDARLWNETGVGRYIRSLFANLPAADPRNEYVWFFKKKEYESVHLPLPHWKKILTEVGWHTLKEQIELPRIYSAEKLDLLHFPYFSFPVMYHGKFVITIHDLIFDHYKTGRTSTLPPLVYALKKIGYHYVLRTATRKAEKMITLSINSKQEIIDHYKVDADRIIVTYESGDLEKNYDKLSAKIDLKIKKLKPYILYVGNAHPHKNVETLIEAFIIMKKSHHNLKLVLVGHDAFFYPRINELIKNKKLDDEIHAIGAVSNSALIKWYQGAECLVSASRMEGFGIPPLEAMSVGCPVIVSDIPVFREIYDNAAVYFNQNEPKSVAETILNTVNSKTMVQNLIKNGHNQARKYSWRKMTEETANIYKEATDS